MKAMTMAALLLCVSCGRTAPPSAGRLVGITWPGDTGGSSGGGASGGGGTGGTAGAGGGCDPHDVFVGSDGCYEPVLECCDLKGADLAGHCNTGTEGAHPTPYLCTDVPLSGLPTDNRTCVQLPLTEFRCTWGASTLICCDEL